MALSSTPRSTPGARRRGRPPANKTSVRATSSRPTAPTPTTDSLSTEPRPKKRKYIPGGPGGGGRFVETDEYDEPITTYRAATAPRPRPSARRSTNGASTPMSTRRPRSTRTRSFPAELSEDGRWGSAAAMAASVQQAEDYKPREERGWEEFHPNLDIEGTFMLFAAGDVDGLVQQAMASPAIDTPELPLNNGSATPSMARASSTSGTPNISLQTETNPFEQPATTPTRRPRRMTRDLLSFHGSRPLDLSTPKTPKILPIQNQTPKERLDLKLPSYRKVNHTETFQNTQPVRQLDQALIEVGYRESDSFPRPTRNLYKAIDGNPDDDTPLDLVPGGADVKSKPGQVEYDMDEQDDRWLENYNDQRKKDGLDNIPREVFEITMTKIEMEWHALEKRIPKPNPKPPQTHRPRSSSAAAVNGEAQAGEEPDSKCAICDDGDCENTNAIVFCDGCDLAVHQECYGVPFIPEGQWLCRKCQLCGRGVPTCIFCPNTDGAFKQTNSSKWAHLLCAMWIPEVSLGNHTFMEPVMEVEKVPKTRWKLSCYICHQKMGACIQCSNKNCYQAFHVTCARRAKLSLKMKTSQGTLAVLDGSMVLKAYCDKHCSTEHMAEHNVREATRAAKRFYKRNMRGRIWADTHTMANILAARQQNTILGTSSPDASQINTESKTIGDGENKKEETPKNVWKLPSGAPVIPQAVFGAVDVAIHKFPLDKRDEYLGEACRYWTLKREARRGAALLKRLQLQMESFSSMELTRRNFAAMGPSGKSRLLRRVEFAQNLVRDLEQLQALSRDLVDRERLKKESAELEQNFVDETYFPLVKSLNAAMETAMSTDQGAFTQELGAVQEAVHQRVYATAGSFAQAMADAVQSGICSTPGLQTNTAFAIDTSIVAAEVQRRREVGEDILKAARPHIEAALKIESDATSRPLDLLRKEVELVLEGGLETSKVTARLEATGAESVVDTEMVDASEAEAAPQPDVKSEPLKTDDSMDVDDNNDDEAPEEPEAEDGTSPEAAQAEHDSMVEESVKARSKADPEVIPSPPDTESALVSTQNHNNTHVEPLTPPQSNGSLGQDQIESALEGGVLWYVEEFNPVGTSAVVKIDESWAGREAVRGLSEDLTDLDDEELKGLGQDLGESVETPVGKEVEEEEEDEEEEEEEKAVTAPVKGKAKGRGNLSKDPPPARRTSARRR